MHVSFLGVFNNLQEYLKLEGTRRVRTHTVLLLILTASEVTTEGGIEMRLLLLLFYLLTFQTQNRPVRAPGAVGFFVRIGPIHFLAGCRKRRLNQG